MSDSLSTVAGAQRNFVSLAVVASLATAAFVPFISGDYVLHLAVSGGLMALAAMPLTVLVGSAGLPSLGTAAFLCIGAFTAGIMSTNLGLGLWPAIVVSAALGLLSGALVAALTLRVSGLYLAVGTLALQRVVVIVATDLDLKLTYASGFMLEDPTIFGVTINSLERWWALVIALLCLVYSLFRYLLLCHIGREWTFLRTHPTAAGALGISVTNSRIQIFALTSAVIAVVGVLDGYYLGNVQAGTYTLQLAIIYLTISALGGVGNLLGAIAASYAIVLLPVLIESLMAFLSIDATSRAAGVEGVVIGIILIFSLIRGPQRIGAHLARLRVHYAHR